ncbi:hypothetical protein WJX73_004984 [Symbiochloris irregularis]|uniref:Uncharacterized protein n=1 Tax=Symbiochloris irregularis TaxID=706552 RepID=A0AAW1P4B3_9CHLO
MDSHRLGHCYSCEKKYLDDRSGLCERCDYTEHRAIEFFLPSLRWSLFRRLREHRYNASGQNIYTKQVVQLNSFEQSQRLASFHHLFHVSRPVMGACQAAKVHHSGEVSILVPPLRAKWWETPDLISHITVTCSCAHVTSTGTILTPSADAEDTLGEPGPKSRDLMKDCVSQIAYIVQGKGSAKTSKACEMLSNLLTAKAVDEGDFLHVTRGQDRIARQKAADEGITLSDLEKVKEDRQMLLPQRRVMSTLLQKRQRIAFCTERFRRGRELDRSRKTVAGSDESAYDRGRVSEQVKAGLNFPASQPLPRSLDEHTLQKAAPQARRQ